jgi:hypothetical protein
VVTHGLDRASACHEGTPSRHHARWLPTLVDLVVNSFRDALSIEAVGSAIAGSEIAALASI